MSSTKESGDYSFLSLLCLGFAVILRSSSLREAARTVAFTGVILLISFVLGKVSRKGPSLPRIFSFEAIVFTVAIGLFESFLILVPSDRISGFSIIDEVLYALLFIPLLADRMERRLQIKLGRTISLFFLFAVTILSLSAIRELGAVGTLWGIEITFGLFGRTAYLAHDSSAALILAAWVIAMRLLMRRHGGDSPSFSRDGNAKVDVPYLDVQLEKKQFQIAVALLSTTLLLGAAVFPGAFGLIILGLPAFLLPLLTIVAQALIIGAIASLNGKEVSRFAETIRHPFVLPLQTAVVLLPIRFLFEKEPNMPELLKNGVLYLASLILLWIFILVLISFIRTFKRKMLFGRRPKSVDGLPFVFILAALGMIVLTAFLGGYGVAV